MAQDLTSIHQDMEAMDIDNAGWVGDAPSEEVILQFPTSAHYGGYGVPLKPSEISFKNYMELVRVAMEAKHAPNGTQKGSHMAEKENRKRAKEGKDAERKWREKLPVPRGPR